MLLRILHFLEERFPPAFDGDTTSLNQLKKMTTGARWTIIVCRLASSSVCACVNEKKETSCHPLDVANIQLPLSFAQVLCEERFAPPA